ncbi:MAG: hypothetical protein PG981_001315 [Wolbachia endosymbiont of Ctenocephalides orientis wCori]|nr:MAG: hypothetical protein PG981_001315 [Wolbachia endosymbiont of Ctenocephalides orientis wCori]
MKKAYLLFILALFTICSTNLSYAKNKNVLLQAPPEISEEIINGIVAQAVLNKEMTWISCFNSKSSCVRFSIAFGANCDSSFQLVLTGNKFIDELIKEEVSMFTRKANTWVYRYGNTTGKKQKKAGFTMFA